MNSLDENIPYENNYNPYENPNIVRIYERFYYGTNTSNNTKKSSNQTDSLL